jgi:hypothetical protein
MGEAGSMVPIVLTRHGDTMAEPKCVIGKRHITEGDKLVAKNIVGIHTTCGAVIFLHPSSKTHNAVRCQLCGLRIPVPVQIDTYGELRQWCEERLSVREDEEDF